MLLAGDLREPVFWTVQLVPRAKGLFSPAIGKHLATGGNPFAVSAPLREPPRHQTRGVPRLSTVTNLSRVEKRRSTYWFLPGPLAEVVCPLAASARTFCQLYTGYFGRLIAGTG